MPSEPYFEIDPDPSTSQHIRKEREKSRKLKQSQWWKNQIAKGICHYCGQKVPPNQLSMDHVVPLARGGKSTRGNVVTACRSCNQTKKLETPVEAALRKLTE